MEPLSIAIPHVTFSDTTEELPGGTFNAWQFTHVSLNHALQDIHRALSLRNPLGIREIYNYALAILKTATDEKDSLPYHIHTAYQYLRMYFRVPLDTDEEEELAAAFERPPFFVPDHSFDEWAPLLAVWQQIGENYSLIFSEETRRCHLLAMQLFERQASAPDYKSELGAILEKKWSPHPLTNLISLAQYPGPCEPYFSKELEKIAPSPLHDYLKTQPMSIKALLLCYGENIKQYEEILSIIHSSLRPTNAKKTLDMLIGLAKIDITDIPYHTPEDGNSYMAKWASCLEQLKVMAPDAYEDILFRVWQTACGSAEDRDAKDVLKENPMPTPLVKEAVLMAAKAPRLLPISSSPRASPRPFLLSLIDSVSSATEKERFFYFAQLFHHGASEDFLRGAFMKLGPEDQANIREKAPMVDSDIMHWRVKQVVQEINTERRSAWK